MTARNIFLQDCWYAAALPEEIVHAPLARTICGVPLVLFRTASGLACALDDRCPHRFAPLSIGRVAGETITCVYHGIEFGGDGTCRRIPQQQTIARGMTVRSYPLVERWGVAWIWMGEAERADPGTIPDYFWLSSPPWRNLVRRYHVRANHEVCADNILDLSHTPYVHGQSIGTPEMATMPARTWVSGDVVHSQRVMAQVTPGPFVYRWGNFGARIDRVTTTEWRPPGNISVALTYRDQANEITLRLTNPLTPETDRTTHVFFMWSRDFGDEADDAFTRESFQVMDEDIAIIEQQQAVIDRGGVLRTVAIASDATLIQSRRVLARLLRAQAR
jgi:phenylpropionate dioxygenase-like ring-hydroxylating dioxygenase large terminal subunit